MYTQICISIKPINQGAVDVGISKLENRLTDIYIWMSQNKLNAERYSGYDYHSDVGKNLYS